MNPWTTEFLTIVYLANCYASTRQQIHDGLKSANPIERARAWLMKGELPKLKMLMELTQARYKVNYRKCCDECNYWEKHK